MFVFDGLKITWASNYLMAKTGKNKVFDGLKITWASNEPIQQFYKRQVFDGLKITWASNVEGMLKNQEAYLTD